MKYFISLVFLFITLNATTLDELIQSALKSNASLASLNERILANKQNTNRSNQFSNPEILILTNTIDSDEPMSQNSITLRQKLPYFGKRDSLKKVSLAQEGLLQENLQGMKVTLVYAIKLQAYKVWELEKTYTIVGEYEDLTKQNIELYESYTSTSDNQHMGIMSAELALSDLKIKKSFLRSEIRASYAQLSYLSAVKIAELSLDLTIQEMRVIDVQKGLGNNAELKIREREIAVEEARVKRVDLSNYPDLAIVAGYAKRENFDDYATFGVGLSLPIYGSEDYELEEARRLTLSAKANKEDTRLAVNAQYEIAYAQMQASFEAYHILNDEALPQLSHMFELLNSSIATGGDLFKYTDVLVKKLNLEEKKINVIASFNSAKAKIEALKGEMK